MRVRLGVHAGRTVPAAQHAQAEVGVREREHQPILMEGTPPGFDFGELHRGHFNGLRSEVNARKPTRLSGTYEFIMAQTSLRSRATHTHRFFISSVAGSRSGTMMVIMPALDALRTPL